MRTLRSFWLSNCIIINIYRINHCCAVVNCHGIIVVSWKNFLKIWPFILTQVCVASLFRKLIKLAIPFFVAFTRRSRKRRFKFRRLLYYCSWILLLVFWDLSWRSLEAFWNCRLDRLAVVLPTSRWFYFISAQYLRINLIK